MLHSPRHLQHKASRHVEGQGSSTPAGDSKGLPRMTVSTVTIRTRLSNLQQLHTDTPLTCKPVKFYQCNSCLYFCAHVLTGTECIVARVCFPGAARAPSAPFLWWRIVAQTDTCDVTVSTCGCTRRPRRPKAPVPISTH